MSGDELFVADTENHEIRRVDLAARKVTTVAGTGQQGREPATPGRRADPRRTALSSPWDLFLHGDDLFIAMAGCHQIWKMRLDGSSIGPYAGNGREDIVDGPLLPRQAYQPGFASFAQPSGLAGDGTWLYVADSEGSSIRAVPLDPRAEVRTVVGTSQLPVARLFTFGDVDGPAGKARFQHPLGVAFYEGRIYVADTYNNKIRVVDPSDGTTRTLLAGTVRIRGHCRSARGVFRAGRAGRGGRQALRGRYEQSPDSRDRSEDFAGIDPGDRRPEAARAAPGGGKSPAGSIEKLPLAVVRAEHGELRLRVELEFPAGYKINPFAPLEYRVEDAERAGPTARARSFATVSASPSASRSRQPSSRSACRSTASRGGMPLKWRSIITIAAKGPRGCARSAARRGSCPWSYRPTAETSVVHLRHRAK